MTKRLFDLVVATLALLLLSPLLVLLALAIRLDSPGPVFFRQERVGLNGRVFRIHKFRTMVVGAADMGPYITVAQDRRITRVGRWLRGKRLDELPQLIDVVLGHMSLVGPRPDVPRCVALYPPAMRERVLSVRPGITAPSSLAFLDEAEHLAQVADPEREYVEVIMPQKLNMAIEYVDRATLLSDIVVLWDTFLHLLGWRRAAGEQPPVRREG